MIGVRCKKMIMINEHIPKHQAKENQMRGCAKPRERDESPRKKNMLNSSSEKNNLRQHEKR